MREEHYIRVDYISTYKRITMTTWWMRKISSSLIHFTFHLFSIQSNIRKEVEQGTNDQIRIAPRRQNHRSSSHLCGVCSSYTHGTKRVLARKKERDTELLPARASSRFVAMTIKARERERWEGGIFSLLELCSFSSRANALAIILFM